MNKLASSLQKWIKSTRQWTDKMTPKVEYFVDKYKVIKVGCSIGIGIIDLMKPSIVTLSIRVF